MTAATLAPPRSGDRDRMREAQTLFDDMGGEPTLDEVLTGVWEGLAAHRAADCPLCGAEMTPVYCGDLAPGRRALHRLRVSTVLRRRPRRRRRRPDGLPRALTLPAPRQRNSCSQSAGYFADRPLGEFERRARLARCRLSSRGGIPSRKVRTSQGRVVGNADPGKPAGKCHRNDTA